MKRQKGRCALVLSGGGARGAYEVGVLKYIFEEFGKREGTAPRFDLICGTSAGAINGCFLATNSEKTDYDIERLADLWCDLTIKPWLQVRLRHLPYLLKGFLFKATSKDRKMTSAPSGGGRMGGLLNTQVIDTVTCREISQEKIRQNLESGRLDALTVSTTEVSSGKTVCFVQSSYPIPEWTRDPRRIAVETEIDHRHSLASASIPFLFPAVDLDGVYYADGSLRQPTPLSPALRLGAQKVLVIGLSSSRSRSAHEQPERGVYPSLGFLLGKLLNAVLLDPVHYDLQVLERINQILEHGKKVYGEGFEETLNEAVVPLRGGAYQVIEDLLIEPSEDIGRLASEIAGSLTTRDWGKSPVARLFRRFVVGGSDKEADFLSYLFFDRRFTEPLIEMGYRDAKSCREKLGAFFQDDVTSRGP